MKIFALILSIYVLFSSIVPCCAYDDCEATEQFGQAPCDPKKDCNDCSPFSICATQGFIINSIFQVSEPAKSALVRLYSDYPQGSVSSYAFSLFQPPRPC